jgi:hypothetical protein
VVQVLQVSDRLVLQVLQDNKVPLALLGLPENAVRQVLMVCTLPKVLLVLLAQLVLLVAKVN